MDKEQIIQREYALHWAVFLNDSHELKQLLDDCYILESIDKLDCRGRSPLMLAVILGHYECAKILLEKGADANIQNSENWFLIHEAICSGDSTLLRLVLKYRDYQRAVNLSSTMRNLLNTLKETDDFYTEMCWEFTSWLPFISKMCPSDTYKIYKRGSSVRIDTTLAGLDSSTSWKRVNQTFIFRETDDSMLQLIVLDHDKRTAVTRTTGLHGDLNDYEPNDEALHSRMLSPVDCTYIDIEKIGFERLKPKGFLSWWTASDSTEMVSDYECKVFKVSNVELVTKTRTEHMSNEDIERYEKEEESNSLNLALRIIRKRYECVEETKTVGDDVYCGLTPLEYLDKNYDMNRFDIGKAKKVVKKSSCFKGTLWLSDNYVLHLQDQILPIIALMAENSTHFARLKNFIELQLPAGFPIKIEIPLFQIVSARITFSNTNIQTQYVNPSNDTGKVIIDAEAFEKPNSYRHLNEEDMNLLGSTGFIENEDPRLSIGRYIPEEELYLQSALEQSFLQSSETFPVASHSEFDLQDYSTEYDRELALAIAESLKTLRFEQRASGSADEQSVPNSSNFLVDDLELVLRLSKQEEDERILQEQRQNEELERVLQLSVFDK